MNKFGKLKMATAEPQVAIVSRTLQKSWIVNLTDTCLSLVVCAYICMSDTCMVFKQRSPGYKDVQC